MTRFFKVAVMALVGFVGYNANAQESSLAIRAGVNFNSLNGENAKGAKSNFGFHAGVTYELGLGEIFYIEPGVYFDTRGFKTESKILDKTITSTLNVYGITVPVLAKVKFQAGDDSFVSFNVGPYANFGISAKEKAGSESLEVKFDDNGLKRFGFGLNFGAGFDYQRFLFNAGYDLGLTEAGKDSKTKFTAFKIGVGYKF